MKQTAVFLCLSALLVLGAASCKKEKQDTTRFTATMEQSEAKTTLANSIAWCSGDQIAVFPTSGDAPAAYGLSAGAGTVSGTFTGEGVTAGSAYYAVYPYYADYTISGSVISGLTLPALQTAVAYSFPADANLMVSQTSTQNFSFKNVCAYIKVTPVESCNSITVTAPGNKLACSGTETFSVNAETGAVAAAPATGSATVTLSGTIKSGYSYLIAVLPVANADITVTYNTKSAGTISRTYTNKTIARGALVDLGVELTYGHEYIDLGLPSGLKWATCNVGAANPQEYGDYFAWGEIEPYYATLSFSGDQFTGTWKSDKTTGYDWASYPYHNGSQEVGTQPYTNNVLNLSNDAARVNWGGSWRMPTQADFTELLNNTVAEWTTMNGVYGRKFKNSSDATKYIFLPAAGRFFNDVRDDVGTNGYYWSATRKSDSDEQAHLLNFGNGEPSVPCNNRFYGYPVRPVCE